MAQIANNHSHRRSTGLQSAVNATMPLRENTSEDRISLSEEVVFQRMAYRKLERQMRGTYKSDKPWTVLWTFLTLLLLFGVIAPEFVDIGGDEEDGGRPSKKSFDIQINIRDLGFLSLMAVITLFTLVYTLTRVVVVVRWSLYWLLAALSVLYLWKRQINLFSSDTPTVILVGFGILEFLTFFLYITMNFLYPPFVKSDFFRNNVGVTWWFGLKKQPNHNFTLTYASSSWFEGRRTCTYRGEVDESGLPHGFGNWLDDSFHGELLSGIWERGRPVGPFRSREFGSGFAFESLRIGYVHCSDDTFKSRNWFPSQTRLPTLGVASVECSVAGGFFSHLPRAEIIEGPFCLDGDVEDIEYRGLQEHETYFGASPPHYPLRKVKDMLPFLKVLYTEHPSSSLIITATRGRGVMVSGHSYYGPGVEPDQLVIDVVRDGGLQNNLRDGIYPLRQRASTDALDSSLAMAEGARDVEGRLQDDMDTSFSPEIAGLHDEEIDFHTPLLHTDDQDIAADDEQLYFNLNNIPVATLHTQLLQQQRHLLQRPHSDVFQHARPMSNGHQRQFNDASNTQRSGMTSHDIEESSPTTFPMTGPYLRVRDWKSTVDGHVEALIFFPGFNASLEHSLERMGQFMAMGRFPPHIKPWVFSWPCARELTYLWATEMASSKRTHAALAALLRGLAEAGVKDVHFLVHSLGAQVVCTSLRDDPTTGERSDVSRLFSETRSGGQQGPLRLRTLTLLNPDTPLSSFVQEDFKCLRRICDHITIVGDRKDGALHWSELGNGVVRTMKGVSQLFCPCSIRRTLSRRSWNLCCRSCLDGCCRPYRHGVDRLFSRVLTVGKSIFSIYVRTKAEPQQPLSQDIIQRGLQAAFAPLKEGRTTADYEDALDFIEDEPVTPGGGTSTTTGRRSVRKWLDVDVIDTSSMETNVHQLRHAYFDLNKILVEDLHELIVTGRRATERSLLLHREGNIFSFCQAPACVVNK